MRFYFGVHCGLGKLESGLQSPAQAEDRVELVCATESVRLNASALSDPNALHVILTSPYVCSSDSNVSTFSALLDSGSSHCFIDSDFVRTYAVPTLSTPPIELRLFDGTSNSVITELVNLPICFPTGESITFDFYVTRLDSSCSVVLGHNWLTRYNPLIDWVLSSLTFRTSSPENPPSATRIAPLIPELASTSLSVVDSPSASSPPSLPQVLLINAAAFVRAGRTEGSLSYSV